MRCTRVADLEQMLLARRSGLRAVSFDVFDTLVRRTLPQPDLSKTPAANHLSRLLASRSVDASTSELLAQRLELEREQRTISARSGADPECRIDDVFRAWLAKNDFAPTDDLLNELLQVELECELNVVFATAGMPKLVRQLKAEGLQLIYLTDMYLRKEMIDTILDVCGYGDFFDAGYVSSESGRAKYSGRIFRQVLEESELEPGQLLHVGDRLEADVAGAARAAVPAIHFTDPGEALQHSTQLQTDRLRKSNLFWTGALWSDRSIAGPERRERMGLDPGYRLAYEYLGPLFSNFMHCVMSELDGSEIELVLFNAREGFLLLELYERLASVLEPGRLPRACYGYLTRKSVYTASLHKFGDREIAMGFHTITPSIRNLCVRFSLPLEPLLAAVQRAGFPGPDEEVRDPHGSPKLRKLISDPEFRSVVEREQARCAELLSSYLEQLGFWGCKHVAMVDVGWNATTQDALAVAFAGREDAPVLHGYYLALLGGKVPHEAPKSLYHGIYHDYRNTAGGTPFTRFLELFETACRAPHPTVIGFERNGTGDAVPMFKAPDTSDYRAERADMALVSTLQAGILDYCDDYVRTLPFHDSPPESESAYILYRLDRLLRFPGRREAMLLKAFAHSEDFGQSLVHIPKRMQTSEIAPGQDGTLKIRQRALWREGECASLPLPGLNILFNLARLIRTMRY